MKPSNIVKSFIALGQESRLAIYDLLMTAGEEGISAGDISTKLKIPAATLSFHLAQLSDAKLIGSRRAGRTIFYSVKYKRIKKLVKYLSQKMSDSEVQKADSGEVQETQKES